MFELYKKVMFQNYANFSGRARRKEYWSFVLFHPLIFIAFVIVGLTISALVDFNGIILGIFVVVGGLFYVSGIIPNLAVTVRRLHDTGKSGWYFLVGLIPFIGGFWLLFLMISDGDYFDNQYGPDPKSEIDEIDEIGFKEIF